MFTLLTPLPSRAAPAPARTPDDQRALIEKANALAPAYRTELLPPPSAAGKG
jgi:hypothetical protein